MAKKGSSGPTESHVTQTNLPEYVRPEFEWLLEEGQAAAAEPYQQYEGPRLAADSADTLASRDYIRQMMAEGTPDLGASRYFTNLAAGNLAGSGQYSPGEFDSGIFSPEAAQYYMDPYIQNVLNVQKDRALYDFQKQQLGRNDEATRAGAFGGSRHGVIDSLAYEDLNRGLRDIDATGMQDAWERAGGLFQQDRTAAMQAQQWGEQSRQFGAGLGLDTNNALLGAGEQLAGLGSLDQQLAMERARALSAVGSDIEAGQQDALDLAYTDFLNQRDYPMQRLQQFSGLLRGVPVSANSDTTIYGQDPNVASQIAGLGIGGLGLAQALG